MSSLIDDNKQTVRGLHDALAKLANFETFGEKCNGGAWFPIRHR